MCIRDRNEGLATGTENFWCVNKEASEEDIQATLDFMNWCVTSEDGTKAMSEDMGFTIPFKTAQESTNVFVKQDAEYTAAGLTPCLLYTSIFLQTVHIGITLISMTRTAGRTILPMMDGGLMILCRS